MTSKIYNISTSMNSTNATNATNSNRRATLIRDQVGCPKMTFRDLPSPNYCYGVKSKRESTGVNEIFRNWENIYKKKTIKRDKNIISITPVEVHGLKTILSPYPIKNIVQTDYTNYDTHDAAYPKIPLRKKIITFPAPKATLSSALAKMCQERKLASQQVTLICN